MSKSVKELYTPGYVQRGDLLRNQPYKSSNADNQQTWHAPQEMVKSSNQIDIDNYDLEKSAIT